MITNHHPFVVLALTFLVLGKTSVAGVTINELSATGTEEFPDSDGDTTDWIELVNSGESDEAIGGYYLSDDPANLTKWAIPETNLSPGSFLMVFASGKDRSVPGAELHANFSLARSGEFLALVEPDGTTIADQFSPTFPEQTSGFSYGRADDGEFGLFDLPTPGTANAALAFSGLVEDTRFSDDRGFYEAPFDLEITCATEGAEIRFTLDGSKPSSSHGTIYSGPVAITSTTTLRAIAYKEDFRPSNVDTHTYLFLDQVLQQPSDPPGFPANWNSSIEGAQQSEYEMDPEVIGPLYSEEEVKGGLRSLPTVCLTTSVDDLFGRDNGIYINAQQRGDAWEREVSMEFFDFPHGKDLQVDTGLRLNGNFSRSKIQPKHNMRVVFREDYGPSKLEFDLFENGKVTRFNSLILRGLSGDSWAHARYPHAQYIRDQWFRDAYELMGYEGIHQREIQLYINGLYWGMYHIFERVEDDSMAERFGGVEEDWEVIKDGSNSSVLSIDGGTARWDALMDIIQAGGLSNSAPYLALQEYLDLDAFIDYLLLNYYGGNDDWCSKNYRAAVRLNPPGKYKFFPHDTERAGYNALRNSGLNKDSTTINNTYRPTHVHHALRANPEYRLRFADRAHRFLFNGGALTEGPAGGLWNDKADIIREALKAECARWGDFTQDQRGASRINTLTEWQALVDREMTVWFPQRSEILVDQLRSDSLYPDLEAPIFNQHGGSVPEGFQLLFTNLETDDVYYTTDGSDPRLAGGGISPLAVNAASGNTQVTMIAESSPGWEYLDDGSDQGSSEIVVGHPGYDTSNWKHPGFAPPTAWETGAARLGYSANETTTLGFGEDRANKHPTTYFRKSFELSDAALVTNLLLEIERDDGVIVYLNGHEIVRDNVPDGPVTFNDFALEGTGGAAESTFYAFSIDATKLVDGMNFLAIELHQVNSTSSDLSIDVRLGGTKVADGAAVPISGQMEVQARSYDAATQTWSALTTADFTLGRPPGPGDLVISELHYNPTGPNAAEAAQPFVTDGSDFEFIEIMNVSGDTLDLSGLTFSNGIDFTFPEGTPLLSPGERLLIANNRAALEFRYSDRLPLPIAGEFGSTSKLANGGEQITLSSGELTLVDFTYHDLAPWPKASDGSGYTLVFISPESANDQNDPSNWRSSAWAGGMPNGSDAMTFTGDPEADADQDGQNAFLEFVLGSDDNDARSQSTPSLVLDAQGHLVFEFRYNIAADTATITIESSDGLSAWRNASADLVELPTINNGDGTATKRLRSLLPAPALSDRYLLRLHVTE